jgi:hypothetical protein
MGDIPRFEDEEEEFSGLDCAIIYLSANWVAILIPSPQIRSTVQPALRNAVNMSSGKDCSPPRTVIFLASEASSIENPIVG